MISLLDKTIARLHNSPFVDGIAAFDSQATHQNSVSSDYDLLPLVRDLPAPVFQMITTIDRRFADIAF